VGCFPAESLALERPLWRFSTPKFVSPGLRLRKALIRAVKPSFTTGRYVKYGL